MFCTQNVRAMHVMCAARATAVLRPVFPSHMTFNAKPFINTILMSTLLRLQSLPNYHLNRLIKCVPEKNPHTLSVILIIIRIVFDAYTSEWDGIMGKNVDYEKLNSIIFVIISRKKSRRSICTCEKSILQTI